ncbi:beta-lactamase regulating signal transducer with metallopeptidase domain [Chthoniobacter flavus]|uniref:M56 family metallopeptidase n=1 Tax=Chthoniobacter flavus TaxID=191863 RepID=UPI001048079C|nr:M56 family metallopeptidase [Chthoniobacter flavus]TCO89415.1 beta-lactamase regulating signal transducer with metallopeptidase domain [Chthoniobacter flavus]
MNTESVLPILGELLAKSALITLAAALLARAWRGTTAAQRHLVWLVALATVMMLPLTRLVAPFWRIPLNPSKPALIVKAKPSVIPMAPVEMASPMELPIAPPPTHAPLDWRKILLGTWLSGTTILLGYRLFGSWRLHRLMRRSTPLDDPRIRLLLSRALSELQLRRRPEIRLSEECRVPVTWGSLRPVMLLPRSALQWSDTWILAALRHEAAHIARYDYLTRWFAQVACALYWPNPLVWMLARSLRVAQELAADDLVLRAGTPADEYASQLVNAAREILTHGFFVRQAVAMACPSTLEDRVRAIVDGYRDRRPLSRLAVACGSFAIAGVLGLSTAAQLRSDEQKPTPETKDTETKSLHPASPQIEIEAKFVEIHSPVAKSSDVQAGDAEGQADRPTIFTDPQFQLIIRSLNQKKGVDILSSPRVTTRANQRAVVEAVREFRTPTEWEWRKESGTWKPTKFETKNLGISLEVEPRLGRDGTLEVHAISSVVEFLGFLDLDTGKTILASRTAADGNVEVPPVVPGHRSKGIYSERRKESTVNLKSGETFQIADLPETADTKALEKHASRKRIMVFISPRLIAPASAAAGTGSDATGSPGAQGELVLHGTLDLNGPKQMVAVSGAFKVVPESDEAFLRRIHLEITDQQPTPEELRAFQDASQPSAQKRQAAIEKLTARDGDAEFLRHVYLVIMGRQPLPEELRTFLDDPQPSAAKRQAMVEKLTAANATNAAQSETHPGASTNAGPSAGPAGTQSPMLAKATKIIIPKIEFREATLNEALEFLRKKAMEFDPDKTGVKISVKPGVESNDMRITLSLSNVPLIEALKYVTDLAAVGLTVLPDALVIQPTNGDARGAGGPPPPIPGLDAAPTPPAVSESAKPEALAESPTLNKATKIILPEIEFRDATLREAVDFLRMKARELDPDKTGINIVVKPGAGADVHITLSLTNIPLIEALHYVAGLAGLQMKAEKNAVVLGPPAPASAAMPKVKTASKEEGPVEIESDKTHMENGVAIAEGNARLAFGKYHVAADTILYHPDTRSADFIGHVAVKDGVNLVQGEEINVTFETGSIKVRGPHRTNIPSH